MNILFVRAGAIVKLYEPFFERLARYPDVSLTVLTSTGGSKDDPQAAQSGLNPEGAYRTIEGRVAFYTSQHWAMYAFLSGAREAVRQSDPDVVFCMGNAGYVSTSQMIAIRNRLKPEARVAFIAPQNVYQRYPLPFRVLEQHAYRSADRVLPIGDEHEQVARRKGYTGKCVHWPRGVDETLFRPGDATGLRGKLGLRGFTVGYVGNLSLAKGVNLLLEAVAGMRTEAQVLLLGGGKQLANLQQQARELGIAERVVFHPPVPHQDMPLFMNAMDALVLPTVELSHSAIYGKWVPIRYKEQFGRVLIEAMACETPVVGSRCGEIPNVIGDAGIVFEQGDVADLTGKLDDLASNPIARAELGARGRLRVQDNYTWDLVAETFYRVCQDMLSELDSTTQAQDRKHS